MNVKLIGINGRYTHSSLALFYVRQQLVQRCLTLGELEIFQAAINDSYYETLLRISSGKPDVLLFSAYVWNSEKICRLLCDLKRTQPSCALVVGGPQAEEVGRRVGRICTVVSGVVEQVDAGFFSDLMTGQLKPRYSTVTTGSDSLFPFPYIPSDFNDHLRNRHIYYESSRGCPYSCSYCLSSIDKRVVHKERVLVERELAEILAHGPKVIRFVDRTFNDQPERALTIWKFLARTTSGTTFHFEISPKGFTEEIYAFLATVEPGLFQFEIGLQSTRQKTLQAINRRIDSREGLAVIRRLVECGNIHLHVDLILGLPFEERSGCMESFARVFETGAHYIQMGLLKILPHTPLAGMCDEFGYIHCEQPPYEIVVTKWLDHAALQELYWFGECVERFMNNRYFPSVWSYLRETGAEIALFFSHLLEVCHSHSFFQLAATQEFMCRLLLQAVSGRADQHLFFELLCYDWLRCGHRFLPDCLQSAEGGGGGREVKKRFYHQLPGEMAGLYHEKNRSNFIKRSFFHSFSDEALQRLGFRATTRTDQIDRPGVLCFLQEREKSLYRLNKAVLLDE